MAAVKRAPGHVVRRRNAWTRARAKRTRPRTPAPKEGWRISQVSSLTGVSVRTLRSYVSSGLLRPLEFRGTATRYPRRELLRLLKMLQLKGESRGRTVLADLKRQVDGLADPDLETWVTTQRLSPELAAALGIATTVAAPTASLSAGLEGVKSENWHRIQLLPGLELMLSSNASPAVRSIAERLCAECVGSRVG